MQIKKILSMVLCLVMLAGLFGCTTPSGNPASSTAPSSAAPAQSSSSQPSAEPIKIASIAPITGANAQNGKSIMNSVNLRLKIYNEAGGYKGRPVVVEYFDDKMDPKEGVNVAQKIASQEDFIGVVGPFSSAVGLAIGSIIGDLKIPLYAISASHEDYPKQNEFCLTQTASMPRSRAYEAQYVYDLGLRKSAYIYLNDDTGNTAHKHFTENFEALGGEVVLSESYLTDQKDFTALITKVKNSGAEMINSYSNYSSAAIIIRQARELDFMGPIYFAGNSQQPEVIDVCGELGEVGGGVFFVSQFSPDYPAEGVEKFVELFQAEYGGVPSQPDYQAWEACTHLLQALTALGPDDPAALAAFMRNNKGADSVYGPVEYIDGVPQAPLPIVTIKDGQFVTFA